MFTGVHHVTYVVEDVAKVEEYMERVFGMKAEVYEEQPALEEKLGFKMSFYKVEDTILDFFQPIRGDTRIAEFLREKGPGIIHVGWEVQDIGRVPQQLVDRGANPRIKDRPADSPQGYKTVSIDPWDNPTGIWWHLASGPMTLK